jgi:geranylgeranyl pyrophosphate synthase
MKTQAQSGAVAGSRALDLARDAVSADLQESWDLLRLQARQAPGDLPTRLHLLFGRQGKRVRSTLLFLIARLLPDWNRAVALHSAGSIELLHVASLAHDDVIDEADIRRGEASAPQRWGNKMAVLVGDYAFARSMKLAIDTGRTSVVDFINLASCQLTAGEVAELNLSRSENPTLSAYIEVIHLKTASLLEACCLCGAEAAGLSAEQAAAAGRFGRHFGLAFQMCDDLLDLGAVADLDKPARTDLANGLVNLPALLEKDITGLDLREKAHLDTPALLAYLENSGVLEQARTLIRTELKLAAREMLCLPDSPARDMLSALLDDLAERMREALAIVSA